MCVSYLKAHKNTVASSSECLTDCDGFSPTPWPATASVFFPVELPLLVCCHAPLSNVFSLPVFSLILAIFLFTPPSPIPFTTLRSVLTRSAELREGWYCEDNVVLLNLCIECFFCPIKIPFVLVFTACFLCCAGFFFSECTCVFAVLFHDHFFFFLWVAFVFSCIKYIFFFPVLTP